MNAKTMINDFIEESSPFYKLLGLKKRYQDDHLDNFPKLYTRNEEIILCAHDYWTPRGKIIWDKFIKIIKGINRLCMAIGIFCLIFGFGFPPLFGGALLLVISLFLWVVFYSPLGSFIGKLLLSKRTVLEFYGDKIVIYRYGYGFPLPVTVKIREDSDLYVDILETSGSKKSVNQSTDAFLIHQDSRRVEIVQGTKRTRVTDVYDEDIGAKIKLGIDAARELWEQRAEARNENLEIEKRERSAAEIVDSKPNVPETKKPENDEDSRWG